MAATFPMSMLWRILLKLLNNLIYSNMFKFALLTFVCLLASEQSEPETIRVNTIKNRGYLCAGE